MLSFLNSWIVLITLIFFVSEIYGDSDESIPQNKTRHTIHQFTLQLLKRIQKLLYLVNPSDSSTENRNSDLKSMKIQETSDQKNISTSVSNSSIDRAMDNETNVQSNTLICRAVTYRQIMMKISPVSFYDSASEDETTSENRKQLCDPLPLNETIRGIVQIMNHTQLIESKVRRRHNGKLDNGRKTTNGRSLNGIDVANSSSDGKNYCIMMMVYAHFCPFSKRVAPIYVSLARLYPQIAFFAIPIHDYKRVKSTMSAFGIPKIFLLRNGRTVAVFNQSVKSFETLKSFIHNHTGFPVFQNDSTLNATTANRNDSEVDYGPFSFDTEEFDFYLLISWTFIICLIANYFLSSSHGERIRGRIVQLWREHEHVN